MTTSAPRGSGSCEEIAAAHPGATRQGRASASARARARRPPADRTASKRRCGARWRGRDEEGALAAADIEQAAMPLKRIGVEHLARRPSAAMPPSARCRRATCRRRCRRTAGTRAHRPSKPKARRLAARAAQQRDRIAQIGVEQGVVLDHRGDRRIAEQRRAQRRPVRSARRARRSTSRSDDRRGKQPRGRIVRQRQPRATSRAAVCGRSRQDLEHSQPARRPAAPASRRSRRKIEQRARASSRDRPRQREAGGPALEPRDCASRRSRAARSERSSR